jgi:hypothetical protein
VSLALPPEGTHLLLGDTLTGYWWEITPEGTRRLVGKTAAMSTWMTWTDGRYTGEDFVVRMADPGELGRYRVEE